LLSIFGHENRAAPTPMRHLQQRSLVIFGREIGHERVPSDANPE
jgi:hypothetical protein